MCVFLLHCSGVSFVYACFADRWNGAFQGVIPTAQRAAIVVGVELPVYDITKKHLIGSGLMGDTVLTHFMYVCVKECLCVNVCVRLN